jgi:hypothetical protein
VLCGRGNAEKGVPGEDGWPASEAGWRGKHCGTRRGRASDMHAMPPLAGAPCVGLFRVSGPRTSDPQSAMLIVDRVPDASARCGFVLPLFQRVTPTLTMPNVPFKGCWRLFTCLGSLVMATHALSRFSRAWVSRCPQPSAARRSANRTRHGLGRGRRRLGRPSRLAGGAGHLGSVAGKRSLELAGELRVAPDQRGRPP